MQDLSAIQSMLDTMFPGMLGIRLIEADADHVVGTMLVRPEMCTAGRTVHGGAMMSLADTLGAVATVLNLPQGHRTVTLESKTNFLGGAAAGTELRGETTVLHKGRTTHVWQTRLINAEGRLSAVVIQTQMIIPISAEVRS